MPVKKSGKKPVRESYCVGCGKTYALSDFYISQNPMHHNGVLPYCRTCCKKICDDRLQKTKSLESALWLTCAEMGVPFVRKVYEANEERAQQLGTAARTKEGYHYFGSYIGTFTTLSSNSTTKWINFRDTDVSLGEVQALRVSEAAIEQQLQDLKLIWGEHSVEELQYLEYRYTAYTEGMNLTEYQSGLYRDLCLAELAIFNGTDIDNATKRKQNIGKVLGIDQFEIDKEKSLVEKMIENDIAVMEQEEPAIYYKDLTMYADHMGIGSYWKKHILRSLVNLLTGSKDYNVDANSYKDGGEADGTDK